MNLNPHTPLADWNSDPGNAAWLDKMLNSNRGRLMLNVLESMAKPTEDFSTVNAPVDEIMQRMALNHCLVSGQSLAITNLRLLSVPPQGNAPLGEPWEYDQPAKP